MLAPPDDGGYVGRSPRQVRCAVLRTSPGGLHLTRSRSLQGMAEIGWGEQCGRRGELTALVPEPLCLNDSGHAEAPVPRRRPRPGAARVTAVFSQLARRLVDAAMRP